MVGMESTRTQDQKPAEKPGRRARQGKALPEPTLSFCFAVSPEYRAWLHDFAAHTDDFEIARTVRAALKRHAKAVGFREPPKR